MRHVVCLLLLCLSLGCAKKPIEYRSFIPDQTVLKPSPKAGGALVWVRPGFEPGRYDQLIIDPVELFIPDAIIRDGGIPLEEYRALATHFEEELRRAMAGRYSVVTEPGPRAVRMRTAITEVGASSPVLYSLTLLNPFGMAMSLGSKALTGDHTFVGSAGIEMIFRDSMTGDTIAMIKDRKSGDKFDKDALSKLGQARDILRDWAVMLRDQADLQRAPAQ